MPVANHRPSMTKTAFTIQQSERSRKHLVSGRQTSIHVDAVSRYEKAINREIKKFQKKEDPEFPVFADHIEYLTELRDFFVNFPTTHRI